VRSVRYGPASAALRDVSTRCMSANCETVRSGIACVSQQRIGDVVAVYIHMLVTASNTEKRGFVTGWCHEDIASAFDMEMEGVKAIFDAMLGRVSDGDYLSGWETRQPKREGNSSGRVAAYRKRKKDEATVHPIRKHYVTQ
jgi:hypothetical protein